MQPRPVAVSLLALAVLAGTLALPVAWGTVSGADGPAPATLQPNATGASNPCVGRMERTPNGTTVVTVQGIAFDDGRYVKQPALAVGFAPDGGFEYAYNATARGRFWAYDVDPLPTGDLLLATTEPGVAIAERVDPATGERTSVERFARTPNVTVATDVDRLPNGNLLVADATPGRERLLVYDPRAEAVVWNWTVAGDGGLRRSPDSEDERVRINDVDRVARGEYLASARDLDQVLLVNRSTGEIARRLGRDEAFRTLDRPSNPQLLRAGETTNGPGQSSAGSDGRISVLVADGGNDRVVEYAHTPGAAPAGSPGGEDWTLTWELVGGGLDEPRDADRLPNGNTLVVDRRGHRVLEVTPAGRVVWEVYVPWQPYDAERVALGDEPGGPPAASFDANRTVALSGSAAFDQRRVADCAAALLEFAPTRDERLLGAFGVNASTAAGATPGAGAREGLRALGLGGAAVVALAAGAFYVLRE
ncbi:hypothetical protein BRC89_06825 [Halobacteriales archaeon QS_4_70_19]|nr:MAG: hypothetical protein BRC89_06825 [Halobacteriales archaeon QS_4_70_19]